jgi:hypothetical protein
MNFTIIAQLLKNALQKVFAKELFKLLQNLITKVFTVQWKWYACGVITTIICVIYNAVKYPEKATNLWICRIIDMIIEYLPKTPDNMKLGYLMNQITNTIPVGTGTLTEIFTGIIGLLSIYLVWKIYRSLPFI